MFANSICHNTTPTMPKATMPDHGNGSDKDPHTSGGFQHVNPARCGRKRLGQRSKGALLSTTFRSCDITLLALPHVCSAWTCV